VADIESLLKRLVENHVEFVIVGGYAAMAHGASLVTQDMDVCCSFSEENLLRIQAAIADLRPVHRMTPARLPLDLARGRCGSLKNLYLSTDIGQLDCLGAITGIGDYQVVRSQSEEMTLAFGTCRVLTVEALIRSKSALGRDRDREAVLQLRAVAERKSKT